jgi:hypothetical protein
MAPWAAVTNVGPLLGTHETGEGRPVVTDSDADRLRDCLTPRARLRV